MMKEEKNWRDDCDCVRSSLERKKNIFCLFFLQLALTILILLMLIVVHFYDISLRSLTGFCCVLSRAEGCEQTDSHLNH